MNMLEAVIFDMDGVITDTASIHSTAWKKMFDEFLSAEARRTRKLFVPFTYEKDYLEYVDGRSRYEGVAVFLESRQIVLPFGKPEDPPGRKSICGLGNRKQQLFQETLALEGVTVFDSTVRFIRELRKKGIKRGVASSSRNCKEVLESAGILDLFTVRVDGVVLAEEGLQGKPAPDIFLRTCKSLRCMREKTVIVEDAVSGIKAGVVGGFGCVLGIARGNNAESLMSAGADLVVTDMEEVSVSLLEELLRKK